MSGDERNTRPRSRRFHEPIRRRTLTPALYVPLVRCLFPEVETAADLVSGFRVLRVGFDVGRLPAGYGVEII